MKSALPKTERLSRSVALPLRVSFEFFPPKNSDMEATLWKAIQRLAPLDPAFISVTYGAGGSTREFTYATLARLRKETTLSAAAHLTCIAATREEIDLVAQSFLDIGVNRIVALRGDPVGGVGTAYEPHPDGYAYASDLVAGLKKRGNFDISVAAYPEGHPENPGIDAEIDNLKRKMDAGADRAITQFFFDNQVFLRFRDKAVAAGVTIPLLPGITPVHNFRQVYNFASRCGASIPQWLVRRFEGLENDPETQSLVASAVAAEQVMELIDEDVKDLHFYTLNRAELVFALCHMLGIKPSLQEEVAA